MNIAVLRKLLIGGYNIDMEKTKAMIRCKRCKRVWYVNVKDIPKIPRIDFEKIISGHDCLGR